MAEDRKPLTERHLRRGQTADGAYELVVTPEQAGWRFSGLRILELERGGAHVLETGEDEVIVIPLRGGCSVACQGQRFELEGRSDAFAQVSDFAYLPRDERVELYRRRAAASRCPRRARAVASSLATSGPPTCPSSCVAPARPAARSTTSARRRPSRPTG